MGKYAGTISGPIAPYSNVPMNLTFYQPSQFVISAITLGATTTVTTSTAHNYVVDQLVRLLIPAGFGSTQLNGVTGYVVSIPSTTQVEIGISSGKGVNSFISSPFSAMITGATQANPCVLTANNTFGPGAELLLNGISGMTQLNGQVVTATATTSATITINVNSTSFSAYTGGGTANINPFNGAQAQIVAVGDIGSGNINSNGSMNLNLNIPGSFINISP